MKKSLIAVLLFPFLVQAQNTYISARVGVAGYYGDLQPKMISLKQVKPMLSIGLRNDLTEHIALRGYFTYTNLQADDKRGTASMQKRNLNFSTRLMELELSGQYNILSLNDHWWTPYVFAGIGVFSYKPYTTNTNGEKVYLRDLSTEGQGIVPGSSPYKLLQMSIPFGFGAEYSINEDMRVGLEFGFRKTFTDYIDDVSNQYVDRNILLNAKGQTAVDLAWRGDEIDGSSYPPGGSMRGNPNNNDGYYYIAATFTMRLVSPYRSIAGLPTVKKGKRVGCPASRF